MMKCLCWRVVLGFYLISSPAFADFTCLQFQSVLRRTLEVLTSVPQGAPISSPQSAAILQDVEEFDPKALMDCLVSNENADKVPLVYLLQGFFEQVAENDHAGQWVEQIGLRRLINRIGFTTLSSPERSELRARLSADNDRWDALEAKLGEFMKKRGDLERLIGRLSLEIFALQAATTAALLGHLAYSDVIPPEYCNSATGFLALCGVVAAQSIGLTRYAWPRWKDYLLGKLAYRHIQKAENILVEISELDPERGIPFLMELATIHGQAPRPSLTESGSIGEKLARSALLRAETPAANRALVAISIRDLECGYLNSGIALLNVILERDGTSPEVKALAKAVKEAVATKNDFETKLSALKRSRIFYRVVGTVAVVGGATVAFSVLSVDPAWLAALKSTVLSVAGSIGVGKIASYVWLRFPPAELRGKMEGEVEALRASFNKVLALNPDLALPFLEGIATPDNKTHPFICEAAFLALTDSNHPSIAERLERIAKANIRMRGSIAFTDLVLKKVIARHRDCNQIVLKMGLPTLVAAE